MNYYEKYKKYKKKYTMLKNVPFMKGGSLKGGSKIIKKVLTINDPYTKDVVPGDVDDWFSILFLAQEYKENLHIIIVDSALRCGKPQFDYMVRFIETVYRCIFYYDNMLDIARLNEEKFDICLISAPLPENVHNFLRDHPHKNTIFYLQGGLEGYNAVNTKTSPKSPKFVGWDKEIIGLETELTNQAFPIKLVNHYYNEIPMCINWNTYQLKKVFSVLHNMPFPFGFWFGPETDNAWKGSGNTQTTLNIILASIEHFEAFKSSNPINKRLQKAYNDYVVKLCQVRNTTPMTFLPNRNKDEEFVNTQIHLLQEKYVDVVYLAQYIFRENVERQLIGQDGRIKQIGELENFSVEPGILMYTPKLFDYNMSATVYNMNTTGLDISSKKEFVHWLDNSKQPHFMQKLNLHSFNKMLKQLKDDFDRYEYKKDALKLFIYYKSITILSKQ